MLAGSKMLGQRRPINHLPKLAVNTKTTGKTGLKAKRFDSKDFLTRPLIEVVGMRHIYFRLFNNRVSVRSILARMSDCCQLSFSVAI